MLCIRDTANTILGLNFFLRPYFSLCNSEECDSQTDRRQTTHTCIRAVFDSVDCEVSYSISQEEVVLLRLLVVYVVQLLPAVLKYDFFSQRKTPRGPSLMVFVIQQIRFLTTFFSNSELGLLIFTYITKKKAGRRNSDFLIV